VKFAAPSASRAVACPPAWKICGTTCRTASPVCTVTDFQIPREKVRGMLKLRALLLPWRVFVYGSKSQPPDDAMYRPPTSLVGSNTTARSTSPDTGSV
jgi:hypothetical protein